MSWDIVFVKFESLEEFLEVRASWTILSLSLFFSVPQNLCLNSLIYGQITLNCGYFLLPYNSLYMSIVQAIEP